MCGVGEYWVMKTCACCGKEIFVTSTRHYTYQHRKERRYFCSYSCMRKHENDYAEKHPPKRKSGGATEKVFYLLKECNGVFDMDKLCKAAELPEEKVRQILSCLKQKCLIYYPHNRRLENKVKIIADKYE